MIKSMPVLEVSNIHKNYEIKTGFRSKKTLKVLGGISFSVAGQSTLGIVGESGCGKSTLAKTIMQIVPPTSGNILIHGKSYIDIPVKTYRQKIQMIFQDPYRSLNPRKKAIDIISEPLVINTDKTKDECHQEALEMMKKVGLRADYAYRYPHMFSGGQRQRIGIARALIMKPEIIVCDEPVSALDVSIQAQVLNLLMDLQYDFGLTYLFISHDLAVIEHMVDHVAVMYLGKIVEYGSREQIFSDPKHPYTQALLASTPHVKKEKRKSEVHVVRGELPSLIDPPSGCAFHSRCPMAQDKCKTDEPLLEHKYHHLVSCHFA